MLRNALPDPVAALKNRGFFQPWADPGLHDECQLRVCQNGDLFENSAAIAAYLNNTKKVTGIKTRKSLIDFALHEVLRHESQKKLLSLKGKVSWQGDLSTWRKGQLCLMTLVDTTVWIDFFTGKTNPQVDILELLISEGQDICICGMVMTEVLQGVREDKQYKKIHAHFQSLLFLTMTQEMHLHSAEINRFLRKRGITIRKPIDCMIASVAVAYNYPVASQRQVF